MANRVLGGRETTATDEMFPLPARREAGARPATGCENLNVMVRGVAGKAPRNRSFRQAQDHLSLIVEELEDRDVVRVHEEPDPLASRGVAQADRGRAVLAAE